MAYAHAATAVLSNLAKAAEKQHRDDEAADFGILADRFRPTSPPEGGLAELRDRLEEDLDSEYPAIRSAAETHGDRGALRAVTWGEKVTKIQKSLVDRYLAKGEALMEGKDLFLCEACGFIYLGDAAPDICPVCKAPASRFSRVK